ncbi:MAG: hypothetical protein KME29_03840 [Calothrix sp. FI2-JRJ7]|jgi:hypothetical protein|nr:hypothetical protein [Calothrix sp. FI2-JRJ7]MBW4598752.1 hypothetical protein [Calothrix sp. FI2-JRJ7]
MEVRLLTEATSAEDTDWIYLQKINGLPRKIKKSNLVPPVQPQSTAILTSATIPSNPQQGTRWNELDSNSNILETWNYINNRWVSDEKKFILDSVTNLGNGAFHVIPLKLNHRYLINKIDVAIFSNGSFNSNDFWSLFIEHQRNNSSVVTSVLNRVYNSNISSFKYSYTYPLNLEINPTNTTSLNFNDGTNSSQVLNVRFSRTAGVQNTGIAYCVEIFYRLIRL